MTEPWATWIGRSVIIRQEKSLSRRLETAGVPIEFIWHVHPSHTFKRAPRKRCKRSLRIRKTRGALLNRCHTDRAHDRVQRYTLGERQLAELLIERPRCFKILPKIQTLILVFHWSWRRNIVEVQHVVARLGC